MTAVRRCSSSRCRSSNPTDGAESPLGWLERILDDARDAGCHKVQLLSHKRHATDGAHHFYRSVGFTPEAEGFRLYLG